MKPKMFLFYFTESLNQAFPHDSHFWLWGFITFLFGLAHSAVAGSLENSEEQQAPWKNKERKGASWENI